LLEGKNVNLRIVEKEDLPLGAEWVNNPDYFGEYNPFMQMSKAEFQKMYDNLPSETKWFLIEKKDGSKIGNVGHRRVGRAQELGYAVLPSERGKGYCSEAVKIMVDYLFLSKDIVRIQAHTDVRNGASQKVLEKAGFKKEGVVRMGDFFRGEWRDCCLYSILREEWKEPRTLKGTEKK
jgi:ribosomal-protein-alanine N-acetyltransferase